MSTTTRQRVVGYGCHPHVGQTVDLCERHAADDGPGAEERLAAGVGLLAQVSHGEHRGECEVCYLRAEAASDADG